MRTRRVRRGAAAIGVALAALACPHPDGPAPDAWVTIRGERIAAERAASLEDKVRGLGGRDSLAWGRGMLFEYDRPAFYAFWMKDMRFDLDLVWIRDGHIVDIHHDVPAPKSASPEGSLPTYRPREMADTILEVPAGTAAALGWRRGDRVRIQPGSPGAPG